MDLTHLANAGQGCMHRLYMWASGAEDGKCGWESILAPTSNASTSTVPFWLYHSQNFDTGSFHDRVHYGRVSMKLNLYGQKNRPVKFTLSLVQFKHDHLTPVNDQGLNTIGTCDDIGNAFWQSRIKRLTANPIADAFAVRNRDMKVLARRVYNIGPTSSDQNDPDPHCVTVRWNHDINRIVSMRKYQPTQGDDALVVNGNIVQVDTATAQLTANYTPFAKDRVYLLIEAHAWTPLAEADPVDASTGPSIDFNFKTTIRTDQ